MDRVAAAEVFRGAELGTLVEDPFPHIVSDQALRPDLADELLREMPPLEVLTSPDPSGEAARVPWPSPGALADPRPSPAWKKALQTCLDALPELLAVFVRRLRNHILEQYPDFETRFAPLAELRAVPRYAGARQRHEVGMDAQIVTNRPAAADATGVRGPHLDMPDKLISALVYLRSSEDDSDGGDLELYSRAHRWTRLRFDPSNAAPIEAVRLARRYRRAHNLLVLPLNSARALHGVSPRRRTPHPRYHLHVVGELAAPLFDVPRP